MGNGFGGRGRYAGRVLVAALALVWAQAVSAAPLVLSCQAADGVPGTQAAALCEAVAAVLAKADPARAILREGPGPDDAIEVTVLKAGKRSLTAELAWRAGGVSGQSPPLSVTVSDAILAPHIYRQLAAALLNESDWPT